LRHLFILKNWTVLECLKSISGGQGERKKEGKHYFSNKITPLSQWEVRIKIKIGHKKPVKQDL
jgi:hypothetical protein